MKKLMYLFFWLLFLTPVLDAIECYQLIDLGFLQSQSSQATKINSQGEVCGIYQDKNKSYAFIWSPLPPHFNYFRIRTSVKPIITDQSEIFGSQLLQVTDEIWDYDQEAIFCWKNPFSFFTFFNVVGLGFPKETAKKSPFDQYRAVLWDVNNQGEMVVMNNDSIKEFLLGNPTRFKYQVWIYYQNEYHLITDPYFSVGFSINNRSEVLGCYYGETDVAHREQKIGTSIYNLHDRSIRCLKIPPNSIGRAINDAGQVVGIFHQPLTHAPQGFLCDTLDNFTILENFSPTKNNNRSLIVGKFLEGDKKDRPAIWEDGELYDLMDLVNLIDDQGHVWDSLDELVDLNDDGYIVGQGKFKGISHGFLLRPIRSPAVSPEDVHLNP